MEAGTPKKSAARRKLTPLQKLREQCRLASPSPGRGRATTKENVPPPESVLQIEKPANLSPALERSWGDLVRRASVIKKLAELDQDGKTFLEDLRVKDPTRFLLKPATGGGSLLISPLPKDPERSKKRATGWRRRRLMEGNFLHGMGKTAAEPSPPKTPTPIPWKLISLDARKPRNRRLSTSSSGIGSSTEERPSTSSSYYEDELEGRPRASSEDRQDFPTWDPEDVGKIPLPTSTPTTLRQTLGVPAAAVQLKSCLNIRVFNASFGNRDVCKTVCTKSSFRIPCQIWCSEISFLKKLIKDVNYFEKFKFKQILSWNIKWFLWASLASWVAMAVVINLADAIYFDLLGDGKSKNYGKQKMWGNIGIGISGMSTGYLIDFFSKGETTKDYTCIFYIMLIVMIFNILISSTLKKCNFNNTNEPSVFWELWSIGQESKVLVFVWWCIGAGMCTGVILNFLFWYIEDISSNSLQKEWLKTLQGLLIGIQCFLGEIPFNFISGTVLRKVGHINVMSLVLLVYAIRFMAYSMFSNVWIFLILEFLHGLSFGLCWPTMVSYEDRVAPSGMKATIQGFIGAIFEGIGVSFGTVICGYLMDNYKGVITFRVFSIGALTWLSIFWVLQLLLQKTKAYPLQQGHIHLASYTPANDDTNCMTISHEI